LYNDFEIKYAVRGRKMRHWMARGVEELGQSGKAEQEKSTVSKTFGIIGPRADTGAGNRKLR